MLYGNFPEGTMPFVAHITEIDFLPLHRHYEAEVIYCLEGEIRAEINGEEVCLSPGEMLYTAPFTPHSYEAQGKSKAVLSEFGYKLLREDFTAFTSPGAFFKKYPGNHGAAEKMKEITAILEKPEEFNRLDLTGQIFCLCGELLRDMKAGESTSMHSDLERIAPALRLIGTNYTENLTIEDACRETGLSPGNFCTLFKNAVGTGFHLYLNRKRTENAELLLKQTDLPVQEVASLSGFSDIKTFYRVFRRETGASPLNFRKK